MSTTLSHDIAGILLPPSQSPRTKAPKPNPRHQAFVRHYLETGNGTKSAILAGYSEKSAAAAASRLLTIPEIKGAIDAELLRQAEMCGITERYVLEGIRAIADDSAAKHADKLRAYELLGKHLRLFVERIEQDSQITVTVERVGRRACQAYEYPSSALRRTKWAKRFSPRTTQHLLDRLTRDPKLARYRPLTPALYQYSSPKPPIELHLEHPPVFHELCCSRNQLTKPKSGGLLLLRRNTPLTRRAVAYF